MIRHTEPIHAATLGEIGIDIPDDDRCRWDYCKCGQLKRNFAKVCGDCQAKKRGEDTEKRENRRLEISRSIRHALYQVLMTYHGWTQEDVRRHMQQERERIGKPIRDRFWSETSLMPK